MAYIKGCVQCKYYQQGYLRCIHPKIKNRKIAYNYDGNAYKIILERDFPYWCPLKKIKRSDINVINNYKKLVYDPKGTKKILYQIVKKEVDKINDEIIFEIMSDPLLKTIAIRIDTLLYKMFEKKYNFNFEWDYANRCLLWIPMDNEAEELLEMITNE